MRIAVVGAGVCGLTAAHRLTRAGHAVDVYERWPGLGGQAATLDVGDGHRLERYYHHLFTSDTHIADLFAELGMPDAIEWRPSSVAFFARGALHPFVTPLDLLRFGPLSPPARVRMGAAVLALQRFAGDRAPYERITARAWIERRMGRQAWDEVWGPLLRGKFGERADDIAMVWLWSKLRLRRSVTRRGRAPGAARLPARRRGRRCSARSRARSTAGGGRVLTDTPAARIERAGARPARDRRRARLVPGRARPARVRARRRCGLRPRARHRPERRLRPAARPRRWPPRWGRTTSRARRRSSTSPRSACCSSSTAGSARTTGPTSPTARCPFVGLIEHTNFVAPARYGGRRFLYVANYLPHGHELLGLDAGALLDRYADGLRAVNPAFSRDWVRHAWRFAEPAAQPIVTVGYAARIPPLQTPAAGLALANTTQVYPEDRGTNYAVRLGAEAAAALTA